MLRFKDVVEDYRLLLDWCFFVNRGGAEKAEIFSSFSFATLRLIKHA
jgi:hypothetical protein